jgi:hypothetical protein
MLRSMMLQIRTHRRFSPATKLHHATILSRRENPPTPYLHCICDSPVLGGDSFIAKMREVCHLVLSVELAVWWSMWDDVGRLDIVNQEENGC